MASSGKVVPFSLPDGCIGAYYPEMNPLVPVWHHDQQSKTPAAKSVPVRIKATDETGPMAEHREPTGHVTRPA